MTIDILEASVTQALGQFIESIVPAEAFVSQVNRAPEPKTADYVMMTPMRRARISTNVDTWASTPNPTTINLAESTRLDFRLDVHGPNSPDNVQILHTVFRDGYAVDAMAGTGVTPLYADDPTQAPFINAASQYEWRWQLDVAFQATPNVTLPMAFADQLVVTVNAPVG